MCSSDLSEVKVVFTPANHWCKRSARNDIYLEFCSKINLIITKLYLIVTSLTVLAANCFCIPQISRGGGDEERVYRRVEGNWDQRGRERGEVK